MKKLQLSILALLIVSAPALSQSTTISPESPRPGDVIKIQYDPSGSDIAGEKSISAVAYLVEDLMPVAQSQSRDGPAIFSRSPLPKPFL